MRWKLAVLVCLAITLAAMPVLAETPNLKPVATETVYPTTVVLSPPFASLKVDTKEVKSAEWEVPNQMLGKAGASQPYAPGETALDPVVQSVHGLANMPSPLISFEGINNIDGVYPPDTEGDIGPNHYMQWVNLHLEAWSIDRSAWTATPVLGPIAGTDIWASLGAPCGTSNDGDPIVLWDRFRSRWVISQFNLPNYPSGPFYQAIAVSKTSDPTGEWWLYCYTWDANKMNDYPKFGVWPDGYYFTVNQFNPSWAGAGVAVFEADKMISGDPTARMLKVDLGAVSLNYGGILPAHFEGMNNPPAGSPGYFVEVDDSTWIGAANDTITLWKATVNWTAGTFSVGTAGVPDLQLATAPFTPLPCVGVTRNCIPQPGTSQKLDSIGDRGMYRLQYRNYGSYEAMVFNHTVMADVSGDRAGVRWYELRKDSGHPDWYIYQQGTYGPADGIYRWMGSVAQDHMGNLAAGYSISDGTSTYPSIAYAGRLASDPAGTLPQAEVVLHSGSGYQSGSGARWGDYSTMSIDPVDDCTFWYTQEYIQTSGTAPWRTRIGAFKFPGCSIGPTGTLAGTVTASAGGTPIVGALVSATDGIVTIQTPTGPGGVYTMTLPVATYNVTGSAFGYDPQTVNGVVITNGGTTTQNFSLTSAGTHTIDGTVSDSGTGWPLYATIAITGDMGYPGTTIYTNPADGYYSITLVDGVTYGFTVTPWVSGYTPGTATVGPLAADATQDFALVADTSACNAPGYGLDYKWFQDFEAGDGGFTTSGTTSWAYGVPTSGPGSAHSPTHAWATNLAGNYNNSENGYITSPVIDLSSFSGDSVILEWWQWLQSESGYDYASVEATSDGVTWNVVYGTVSGTIDSSWAKHSVVLGSAYATASFQFRFHFTSDSSVSYPGWYVDDVGVAALPSGSPVLNEGFEIAMPPTGWGRVEVDGSTTYQWVRTTSYAHSGSYSAYHSYGDGSLTENGWLITSFVTVPASGQLTFWERSSWPGDYVYHGVWACPGTCGSPPTNWTQIAETGQLPDTDWRLTTIDLSAYGGQSIRLAFVYQGNYADGWYIDDVQVGLPPLGVSCIAPSGGGLIYGNVYDANTMTALSGAVVSNATTGQDVTTTATPDPAVDDGFYCMYGPDGTNDLSATKTLYGTDSQSPTVPHFGVVQQDFALAAGQLAASPASLSWTTGEGGTGGTTLTLSNIGGADVNWTVKELNGQVAKPTHNLFTLNFHRPVLTKIEMMNKAAREEMEERKGEKEKAEKTEAVKTKQAADDTRSNSGRAPMVRKPSGDKPLPTLKELLGTTAYGVDLYVGGGTVVSFDSSVPGTFTPHGAASGLSFYSGDFYMGDTTKLYCIDSDTNTLYAVDTATGVPTSIGTATPSGGESWSGMTCSNTGVTYVCSTSCASSTLYTIDLTTAVVTPIGTVTNAGCLIDIAINTAGELYGEDIVNDNLVRIDTSTGAGTIIGSTGFNANYAQGMDFDDATGTLYLAAFNNDAFQGELRTCDTSTGASTLVGAFQGGTELDCLGFTSFVPSDIPWLDENPKTGTVTAGGSVDIDVTYDATGLAPGIYEATLSFENDTPYGPLNVPVTLTVVEPVVPVATASVTSGTAPLAVNFTGTATGGIGTYTYDWDFGDGSPHSAAQNPSHTYNIGGNFTVTLTVTASVIGSGVDNHLTINVTPPAIPVVNNFYDDLPRNLEQACFNRLTGAYVWTVLSGPNMGTVFTGTAAVFNGGAKFTNKAGDPNKFSVVYDPVRHKASGWLISGGVYYPLSDSNTLNNPGGCY